MFQFLVKTLTQGQETFGCRPAVPAHVRRETIQLAMLALAVVLSQTLPTKQLQAESNDPLNVVFILADDLGWSDTTLFGTTRLYQTPNLERLAARGITFTNAYANSPLCSPTRASILTGQTPARHGSTAPQHHTGDVRMKASVAGGAPAGNKAIETQSVTRLDTDLPTLGKLFRSAGYATAHFGKWHLGPEPFSPIQHGFDVDVPHYPGPGPAGSFVAPWKFPDLKEKVPHEHLEDRMADEAVAWMSDVESKPTSQQKPFFLNYWQFSVHAPFDAKPELIGKYKMIRKFQEIDRLNDPQRSPTYAAMVESFDDAIGELLDQIDRAGIADRTIIIMTSDNGGNMYDEIDGTTPTSNAPLRGGKASMFEGGVRVPCVVVWPGITTAGARSDEVIQTSDFYPTLLNQIGIEIPDNHPVDGIDITPALRGGSLDRKAIFTYFPHSPPVPDWLPPAISVVQCDQPETQYKLIRLFHQGENGKHGYLLYNLTEDIGETNNLAASMPDKVAELDAMIQQHLKDTHAVVPVPNPKFDAKQYHPETIGIGAIRNPKEASAAKNPGKPIDGWVAAGTCDLAKTKQGLRIRSTGDDPYVIAQSLTPQSAGPYQIHFRMKSDSQGDGQLFYSLPFAAARSVSFAPIHDGQWHDYDVAVTAGQINGLRIDPSRSPGTIELKTVWIENAKGKRIQTWEFFAK